MPSTSCGFEDSAGTAGSQLLVLRGPTLEVDIGFDAGFQQGVGITPDLAMKSVEALVDTGATQSCIDSDLAATLKLPVVDQAKVAGVSGERTVNMHLAQIYVPSLKFTVFGQFAGVDLGAGGQSHVALIGRTFLRHFKLMYDGTTGEVIISHPDEIEFKKVAKP